MATANLGFEVTGKTGNATQSLATLSKGFADSAAAARAARAQFDALSKSSADMSKHFQKSIPLPKVTGIAEAQKAMADFNTSGIVGRLNESRKAAADANRALGYLGAGFAATSAAAKELDRTISQTSANFKGIGAALGMTGTAFADVAKKNQSWFDKLKDSFAQSAIGARIMGVEHDKTAKKVSKNNDDMAKSSEKVGLSFRGWLPHIRTAAASIGIYLGVRTIANIVKMADAYTDMASRLKLVSGNTDELTRAQEGLFKIAQANRTPIEETTNLYYKLAVSMRDLGASQKDVLQTVDTVGKAMRISGASTIETTSALMQLSQAFAKGKLDGDEFRATMENAPRLMKALTDEFGISKAELYKWSETGVLSVEKLLQAIKNQSGVIEQEFGKIPLTLSGAGTQLSNAFKKYIGDADQARGSSRDLAEAISSIARNLDLLMTPFAAVAKGWGLIFDAISNTKNVVDSLFTSLKGLTATDALKWFLAPDVSAWQLIKETLSLANSKAKTDFNQAISTGEWNERRNKNGASIPSTAAYNKASEFIGMSETKNASSLVKFLNEHSGTVFNNLVKPWCARFVSASLDAAGVKNAPHTARARDFLSFGESVWEPSKGIAGLSALQQGDIAIFSRGNNSGQGHVAFVQSADVNKGTLKVLGGNQGNAVTIDERSITRLLGVRRPTDSTAYFTGRNVQDDKLTSALNGLTAIQQTIVKMAMARNLDPALMLGLAQRESSFNPNATSNKGAMGLWQLMPDTGKQYGLKSEADFRDVEKSTAAGLAHFKSLMDNFQGDVRKALAAYNMGESKYRRLVAAGKNPEEFTDGPHVQKILQYRQQWQAKMGDALSGFMSAPDMAKQRKDFEKVLDDQYSSYAEHLKRLEGQRDNHNTVELSQQRVAMEKLEAEREKVRQRDAQQLANAQGRMDMGAVDKITQQQRQHEEQFLKDKQTLLLKGMDLEKQALTQRKAHIGQMIAEAQKLKGDQLEKIPGLRDDRAKVDAELAELANKRKEAAIKFNAEINQSNIDAEEKRRKAMLDTAGIAVDVERNIAEARQAEHDRMKQNADDFVAMEREKREVMEAEFKLFQDSMALQIDQAKAAADSRKADIDGRIEQAKAQAAVNEEQRQSALEGKEGLEAIGMARQNLNAKLSETLNLITMERDANLEKLRIDGEILASQRALLETYKAIAEQQGDRGKVLDYERQLQDVYTEQTKNIRARLKAETDAVAASAKAQVDNQKQGRTLDGQEVKESQLRMNAFWDQYMSRLRDYASLWQEITGQTENGWSRMALATGEYAKQYAQIDQYWKSDEAAKAWKNAPEMMKPVEALQQGQAAAAMMVKTMIIAREQTEKGSQAYNNLTTAAENFMQVLQLLNVAEGIAAVLKQLKDGDPYTAAIRAAGVAMMVASMGINTGFGGGGSSGMSNRQARDSAQAGGSAAMGGGVFGDTSAKSESISKALEIVAQNSSANLAYSAGMLRSLKNIELAMAGTTNAIIRGVGPTQVNLKGTTPFGMNLESSMMRVIDPLGSLLGLTKITQKITNWGIKALPQSLDQIIAKGFAGMNWTEVTKTVKVLGMTVSKSVKNIYSALDDGVTGQITRVIRGMADTVREAGKAFGISGEQFNKAMSGFVVNFGTLATKGMKSDELEKAVQQVFSSMSDDMAQQFQANFGLNLEPFMRAGEGMFETLVRVADGINTATGILAQFGMEAINYNAIILKQGDVAAEIVRQSIVAFEGATSAIGAYVDQAVGSAEELMAVYRDLLIVSDISKIVGFNLNDLTQALIVTSGGVAQFLSNLTTYQTEIAGGSEYARQIITLRREFAKLGESLPANNREFVKLVNGIDTSTEAGQRLYAQVIALADGFAKAQVEAKKLDELRAKYKIADPLQGYRDQLAQIDEDFKAINEGVIARMKGGPQYIKRTGKIDVLRDRIDDRELDRDLIQADIDELEAKGKLTAAEKQRLASLRQQRKALNDEIAGINKQIEAIEKLIKNNPNTGPILEEKAKLIEEQGNAILKTIADIWDQMTANINAAKETLINIQNDIYELTFTAGSTDIKLGMATAKRTTAEAAYNTYTGDDIVKLREYADEYHKAIMDEYNAKLDMINAPKIALEKERDLAQKAHDEKIAALEKELGVTKELFDAVKNIQDYAKALRMSSGSTLSPKKLLDEAKKQYEETLRKAQGGDVDAMRDITGKSDQYLDAARKYFGSGGKYGQIFDSIASVMDQLGMTQTGDAQSIQDKIDALNKDHEVYLKGIEEKIAALKIEEAIKALQLETADKLQKLADNLAPRIEDASKKAQADMKTLIDEVIAQKVLSADQLKALQDIAKGIGIEGYQTPEQTNPALPAPTDDWVQGIYDAWIKGQIGYQPPPSAFGMSSASGLGMASAMGGADYMPTIIEPTGDKIGLEKMPIVIDDRLIRQIDRFYGDNQAAQTKDHAETIAALHELRTELRALVTTQSGANPQLIERLENIERRLAYMERDAKLKPA